MLHVWNIYQHSQYTKTKPDPVIQVFKLLQTSQVEIFLKFPKFKLVKYGEAQKSAFRSCFVETERHGFHVHNRRRLAVLREDLQRPGEGTKDRVTCLASDGMMGIRGIMRWKNLGFQGLVD